MCENEKKKYHSIEMTTGSLWKNILLFSLPLMGSQVLEVLFNLSDVAVVGQLVLLYTASQKKCKTRSDTIYC